jgi:hypothetical protein
MHDPRFQIVNGTQHWLGECVRLLPGASRLQRPRLAVKQRRAQRIFQVLNSAGHGRLSKMKARSGRHDGTVIHNRNESFQVNQVH